MKIFFLFLVFMSIQAFAVEVDLYFPQKEIKQGDVADATLKVSSENMNSVPLNKLRGVSFAKTIYFYQFSPWMHENGSSSFNSNAKVIFLEAPQGPILKENVNGVEIELRLSEVQVIPTEPLDSLKFADFTIPSPVKILKWVLAILGSAVIGLAGWFGYKKYSLRKAEKIHKVKLKEEISSAQDYEAVVEIWKQKRKYLASFPHLEKHFQDLEAVLFKYQFKPSQLPSEKQEVVNAYRRFVTESQEGLRGV